MPPKYECTQKGSRLIYYIAIFMILEILAIEVLMYILGTRISEPIPQNKLILIMLLIPLVHGIILGWAFLMMSALTVSIDHEFVCLRFGAGMWKKLFELEQITNCKPVKNSGANGWGIRYLGKGCWLYNIAGFESVEIIFKDGKKARIGTDEPEKLADAIQLAIQ